MPRIAAALGVLTTVAFCIGFNIQRYPVVWQSLAAAPSPLVGSTPSTTVAEPFAAVTSAIRPATNKTAAEAKGLPQPIPLPQVAGLPRPIPSPDPARSSTPDELAPEYEMATAPAEKYAGPVEGLKPSVAEKPKPQPAARKPAEAKKPHLADAGKAKAGATPKAKTPDKAKPLAADKHKAPPDKAKLQAQKAKPSAVKPVTQIAKAQPEKVQAQSAEPPKPAIVAVTKVPAAEEQVEPVVRIVERPLVPVPRLGSESASLAQPGWNTSRSPWASPIAPDRSLRRLPPVNWKQGSLSDPFGLLQGRIPFYPTTGR